VTGTFAKLFNNETNVDLTAGLTVFSIRDIEDSLKTPAMYNVLNYIWTKGKINKTKRLLIIDEAWIMLQKDISANFLFGLIKRARKYKLGVTTISQDVDDFIKSPYGKPIVTNSALQILLRQSTASIQGLEKVFWIIRSRETKTRIFWNWRRNYDGMKPACSRKDSSQVSLKKISWMD
jgi:conjugal transfer ATP-binding protein TraC